MAAQMFLSRNAIKSQANAIYRKPGATTHSQAVPRSRDLGFSTVKTGLFPSHPIGGMPLQLTRGAIVRGQAG
jgi:hypothetical protein